MHACGLVGEQQRCVHTGGSCTAGRLAPQISSKALKLPTTVRRTNKNTGGIIGADRCRGPAGAAGPRRSALQPSGAPGLHKMRGKGKCGGAGRCEHGWGGEACAPAHQPSKEEQKPAQRLRLGASSPAPRRPTPSPQPRPRTGEAAQQGGHGARLHALEHKLLLRLAEAQHRLGAQLRAAAGGGGKRGQRVGSQATGCRVSSAGGGAVQSVHRKNNGKARELNSAHTALPL